MKEWIVKNRMAAFFFIAILFHAAAFLYIRFAVPPKDEPDKTDYEILKLVDVEEYVPPPVPPDVKVTTVYNQPTASESVVETDQVVVETNDPSFDVVEQREQEPVYLPQHKISQIPDIPTKEILARIEYPPIALRQGLEGVVYLELYIDQAGNIRKVNVLKDPGYGFADAAVAAITGVTCKPAMANERRAGRGTFPLSGPIRPQLNNRLFALRGTEFVPRKRLARWGGIVASKKPIAEKSRAEWFS